jgi:outer membrane scaffolding protein for murein synthesis (MipA/OmpV family)
MLGGDFFGVSQAEASASGAEQIVSKVEIKGAMLELQLEWSINKADGAVQLSVDCQYVRRKMKRSS